MMLSTSIKKLSDTNNRYGNYTAVLSTSKMNRSGDNAHIPDKIIKIANKYKIPIFITKN